MGKVIQFPKTQYLKNINKRPKLTQEEISKVQLMNDKRVADQLSESLAIDILTVLQESISDMQKTEFIADLAILIEVIKSTLYREHDLKHPMQEIIAKIATVKVLPKIDPPKTEKLSTYKNGFSKIKKVRLQKTKHAIRIIELLIGKILNFDLTF